MKIRQEVLAAQMQAQFHCDASEAITFARELLRVRAGLFEIQFPELKAQGFMPRNGEMSPVDEEFTYQTVVEVGATKLGSSYSTDAPRADVYFQEATPQQIRPITSAYGYSFHEALVSAQLNRNLPMRKAAAARKAIAHEIDRILSYGGSAAQYGIALPGLLTQTKEVTPTDSGVRDYTPPLGAGGFAEWLDPDDVTPLKTPDEILRDMFGIQNLIVKASNDVEHPSMLLLPLACYQHIASTRLGDGSDVTILRHFMGTSPHVRRVEPWFKLDAAPSAEWTGRRMMCYDMRPDVLEYLLPVEFRQQPPQLRRMETLVDCDARIGGAIVYRPKAIAYGDGI
jgi:hypothetical protein